VVSTSAAQGERIDEGGYVSARFLTSNDPNPLSADASLIAPYHPPTAIARNINCKGKSTLKDTEATCHEADRALFEPDMVF